MAQRYLMLAIVAGLFALSACSASVRTSPAPGYYDAYGHYHSYWSAFGAAPHIAAPNQPRYSSGFERSTSSISISVWISSWRVGRGSGARTPISFTAVLDAHPFGVCPASNSELPTVATSRARRRPRQKGRWGLQRRPRSSATLSTPVSLACESVPCLLVGSIHPNTTVVREPPVTGIRSRSDLGVDGERLANLFRERCLLLGGQALLTLFNIFRIARRRLVIRFQQLERIRLAPTCGLAAGGLVASRLRQWDPSSRLWSYGKAVVTQLNVGAIAQFRALDLGETRAKPCAISYRVAGHITTCHWICRC